MGSFPRSCRGMRRRNLRARSADMIGILCNNLFGFGIYRRLVRGNLGAWAAGPCSEESPLSNPVLLGRSPLPLRAGPTRTRRPKPVVSHDGEQEGGYRHIGRADGRDTAGLVDGRADPFPRRRPQHDWPLCHANRDYSPRLCLRACPTVPWHDDLWLAGGTVSGNAVDRSHGAGRDPARRARHHPGVHDAPNPRDGRRPTQNGAIRGTRARFQQSGYFPITASRLSNLKVALKRRSSSVAFSFKAVDVARVFSHVQATIMLGVEARKVYAWG